MNLRGRRLVLAALAASPCWLAIRSSIAQVPGKTYRVGVLRPVSRPQESASGHLPRPMEEALARHGFKAGMNLRVEEVLFDAFPNEAGSPARLAARKLVAMKPDAIFTIWASNVVALQLETSAIPIVFALTSEGVGTQIYQELRRPGRNATGVVFLHDEMRDKRLEIIRELLPEAKRVAVIARYASLRMFEPSYPRAMDIAANRLGMVVVQGDLQAHGGDIDATLATVLAARPDAIVTDHVLPGVEKVHQFARQHRIAFIGNNAQQGVVGIGVDHDDHFRRAGEILARVLVGRRVADIPVDRDTRLIMTVNLAIAQEIGVSVPRSLLVRAENVIR